MGPNINIRAKLESPFWKTGAVPRRACLLSAAPRLLFRSPARSIAAVQACTIAVVHASIVARVRACTIAVAHACTIGRVHALTIAIVHACSIGRVHECSIDML